MTHMFEEKTVYVVGSHAKDDTVLPWDVCHAAVFFPTRADILESEDLCVKMFAQAGQIVQRECRDENKAKAVYILAIKGAKSMSKVTKEEVLVGRNVPATNCISESTHASSTVCF